MPIHEQPTAKRAASSGPRHAPALLAGILLALCGSGMAHAADAAPASGKHPHTITYDRYSMKIDGQRAYIWAGEFHYWRLPSPSLWTDVLQKMKAAGYNAVTIYFDWGYHSPSKGVYDFSGIRDVDRLLDIANKVGIYVIARPGPYINAETDAGGFPDWLTTIKGKARTNAPDYTAAYMEWLTRIDRILARHQLSNGTGTVILYQVENEFYDESPASRFYMRDVENKARADGITVPLAGNHNDSYQHGIGAVEIPGYDSYPLGFDCSHPQHWSAVYDFARERRALTKSPLFLPEFQGGSFDNWRGPGYDKCRQLVGPEFERVFYEANMAAGSTMQSFYMTYGGTSWGWLASPGMYTSYDYAAAIDEGRRIDKKYDQQKLLGYFTQTVQAFTKTVPMNAPPPTNPALRLDSRVNPDDGTRFYILRHADGTSTANDTTQLSLDLSAQAPGASGHASTPAHVTRVPQQPGTTLRVNGRDSKILLANYRFGHQKLVYSTSELMTDLTTDGNDLAVFYGRNGEDGETVLRYDTQPTVHVISGHMDVHWDASLHSLRLNYKHHGLARAWIKDGRQSLLLLVGDNAAAASLWKVDTGNGPVLVRGPHLLRDAAITAKDGHAMLALQGDTDQATPIEVFASSGVQAVEWNGLPVTTTRTPSGSLTGQLDGPKQVSVPSLTHWKYQAGSPEIQPGFDDSGWQSADHKHTDNPYWNGHLPILNSDVYGFHHGEVWYRGHFIASGHETAITLDALTGIHLGNYGVFSAWLNGHFLGSNLGGTRRFAIDPAELKAGKDNVVSVLVENTGHNQEVTPGAYKEPRGLASAVLAGSSAPIHWKIQGNPGGETPIDAVRGPFNSGGLFGERMGWSLQGFPDAAWRDVSLPVQDAKPGVDWYRTEFALDIPAGQDVPIALKISDDPSRHYRLRIFINGWQVGRYINDVGPQHVFVLPAGILNTHGKNTISIASWGTEHDGGLGNVSLQVLGNYLSALHIEPVTSPAYDASKYQK